MMRVAHCIIHTADASDPINQFYRSFSMLHSTDQTGANPSRRSIERAQALLCPAVRRVQDSLE